MKLLATDRWAEIDVLFDAALDRPADERTAFLRVKCGHDADLYHAVTALLDSDAVAGEALGESAAVFTARMLEKVAEGPAENLVEGAVVGPYRIARELGRGGMGTVFLAERADGAFEKQVALKVVKRGMDTDEVLRRFRYERQILAGLNHPNIARLLEAGATEDGRPYLVMELADGEAITAFAASQKLDLDERMRIFEQVCEAVAYAHRHFVVHRDLKPSNILVAAGEDGTPEVKLLDFGIAKLLEEDEDAPLTRPELRILTPEYAAPEQRTGGAVTAATDVYALGVVLYELFTGQRPGAPVKPPSAVVTDERFQRSLRGDLDTIALTALHEDAARRYASAEALLDDLHRWRTGLPLHARPDKLSYRVRKFVGRHKLGVGVGALVGLLLVSFVAMLAGQQRKTARALEDSEATAVFLESLFAAANPFAEERLDTLRVEALLDRGAARVLNEFEDQPRVRARMLHALGRTYLQLKLHEPAEPLLREALELRRGLNGPDHESVAESLHELAWVRYDLDDMEEAKSMAREALAIRRRQLNEPDPLIAASLGRLGQILQTTDGTDEAEDLHRAAVEMNRTLFGDSHPAVTEGLSNLAMLHLEQGRPDSSVSLQREVVALQRRHLGNDHPTMSLALHWLAFYQLNTGAYEEGENAVRRSLEIEQQTFGESSHRLSDGLNLLGLLLRRQSRYEEAETVLLRALAISRTPGADYLFTQEVFALEALATLYKETNSLSEAEQVQREALALRRDNSGEGVDAARSASKLAGILRDQGRFQQAEALLLENYATLQAAREDPHIESVLRELVTLYEAWGRPDEAARWRDDVGGTE